MADRICPRPDCGAKVGYEDIVCRRCGELQPAATMADWDGEGPKPGERGSKMGRRLLAAAGGLIVVALIAVTARAQAPTPKSGDVSGSASTAASSGSSKSGPSAESGPTATDSAAKDFTRGKTASWIAPAGVSASCDGDRGYKTVNGNDVIVTTTSDMLVDGDLGTFWRCAMKVDPSDYTSGYRKSQPNAVGQKVTFQLGGSAVLDRIGIVNGWPEYDPEAKNGAGANRYSENGRVTQVKVQLRNDGVTVASKTISLRLIAAPVPVKGSTVPQDPWLQERNLPSDVIVDEVIVTITKIRKGKSTTLDYTAAMGEVALHGWR